MRIKKLIKSVIATTLAAVICLGTANVAKAAGGQWMNSNGRWWYKNADGSYQKNQWMEDGGKWYYFDEDGYMDYEGYRQGYWLNTDGSYNASYSGGKWYVNNKGWWWADKSGWYPKDVWLKIDGKYYHFSADGYLDTDRWIGSYYVDKNGAWDPTAVKDSYVGEYHEKIAGRAYIVVSKSGNQYEISARWPDSAAKHYEWVIKGTFDSKGVMTYKNAKCTVFVFDTNGNYTKDNGKMTPYDKYTNGTGTIKINGSKLEWVEKDGAGKQIQKSEFVKDK
ncbi:MAG: hypothetical protein J5929_08235 [Eubacterium sp.]|nr:hypothetical protein [Eubacterium sp.]